MIKTILLTLSVCLLLVSCSDQNCADKPHSCRCVIDNDFPEIAEIIDSIDYSGVMEFCRYQPQNDSLITLKGRTETQPNGYFYTDSAQFTSLTIHKFHFYNNFEKTFLFDLVLYEFKDQSEALLFSKFKESISRDLSGSKEQHTFFKKNGKHIMYYEGFP